MGGGGGFGWWGVGWEQRREEEAGGERDQEGLGCWVGGGRERGREGLGYLVEREGGVVVVRVAGGEVASPAEEVEGFEAVELAEAEGNRYHGRLDAHAGRRSEGPWGV